MIDYDQLIQSALIDVEKSDSIESIEQTRVKYFGKNGIINKELAFKEFRDSGAKNDSLRMY